MTKRRFKILSLIALEMILCFYCYISLNWYFTTELVSKYGTELNGVVTELDPVNQNITFLFDDGSRITNSYDSEFLLYTKGDTLKFKRLWNRYRHIHEQNPSALAIGLILLLLIGLIGFILFKNLKQSGI